MSPFKQIIPEQPRKLAGHTKGRVLSGYRHATWRNRVLPDFLIVGAQKSGTTSLHHYLRQHRQLVSSYGKEVHFFDGGLQPEEDNFRKGQAWYRAHFPSKLRLDERQKTFETSPAYIFNPLVPERISELLPDAKLIVLLRNPVDRAISQWFHEKRYRHEHSPIMQALLSEEDRLARSIRERDYKNDVFIHCSYKSRGLYHEQIKRYLRHFPKENILVLKSEKLFSEPADTLKRIFSFLGVDTAVTIGDLGPANVGDNRSAVDPEVYEYLNAYFRAPNQALYELIGEDYGW